MFDTVANNEIGELLSHKLGAVITDQFFGVAIGCKDTIETLQKFSSCHSVHVVYLNPFRVGII